MNKVRIGTRDSKLAMIQANIVADAIKEYDNKIEIEIVPMKTTGDIILDKTLDKIGGKGLFVKELDKALLEDKVDITVHSMKDMTMDIDPSIPILATGKREDYRDVLVLPKGKTEIDFSLPIGSSSARRNIQLKQIFKDVKIKPIRGNLITRLEKLDNGEYSALVLAAAGLKRLGMEERISKYFDETEIIPANCQAVICVQGRADFPKGILSKFNDEKSFVSSMCERAFIKELDGGCSLPIAAFAKIEDEKINLVGLYVREDEFERYNSGEVNEIKIYSDRQSDILENAEKLGIELAKKLKGKAR